VCIVLLEQSHVHQFKKIKAVVIQVVVLNVKMKLKERLVEN